MDMYEGKILEARQINVEARDEVKNEARSLVQMLVM